MLHHAKPVRYGDHEGAFTFEQNVNRKTVLQIGDPQYDMCKPLLWQIYGISLLVRSLGCNTFKKPMYAFATFCEHHLSWL
jgi:hypothetical protein